MPLTSSHFFQVPTEIRLRAEAAAEAKMADPMVDIDPSAFSEDEE